MNFQNIEIYRNERIVNVKNFQQLIRLVSNDEQRCNSIPFYFFLFYQVLRIWYWEHCPGGITTETFLRNLKKWEHSGFISGDVWSNLGDIVDSETIKIDFSVSIKDEFEKLREDDKVTERVLSCVSRHMQVTSRLPQFALEILRLKYEQYEKANLIAIAVIPEFEMIANLKVCHQ